MLMMMTKKIQEIPGGTLKMSKRATISLVLFAALSLVFTSSAYAFQINRHDQLDHLKHAGRITRGDQAVVKQNDISMIHQVYVSELLAHPTDRAAAPPAHQVRYKRYYVNGSIPDGSLRLDKEDCWHHMIGKVTIKAEGNFVLAAYEQFTTGGVYEIYAAYSGDQGKKFNRVLIYRSTSINGAMFLPGSTRIFLDEAGNMSVLRQQYAADNVEHQNVFITSSFDEGATWATSMIGQNHPAKWAPNGLSVAQSGPNRYAAWLGNREESLVFTHSSDYGRTWTQDSVVAPYEFSTGDPNAMQTSMAVTSNGNMDTVHILGAAAEISPFSVSYVSYVRSTDSGESWESPQALDFSLHIDGIAGPRLAVNPANPDQLWAAYFRIVPELYRDPSYYLVATGSHDGGRTWERSQVIRSTGIRQFIHPDDQFKDIQLVLSDSGGYIGWFSRNDAARENLQNGGWHYFVSGYTEDSWQTLRADNLPDERAANPNYGSLTLTDNGVVATYSEVLTGNTDPIMHRHTVTLSTGENIPGGDIEVPPLADENQVPDHDCPPGIPIEDSPAEDHPRLVPVPINPPVGG